MREAMSAIVRAGVVMRIPCRIVTSARVSVVERCERTPGRLCASAELISGTGGHLRRPYTAAAES
jgi:hypothetical protein